MLGPGRLHTRKPRPSSYGVSSWIMERHLRRPFSGPQEVPGGATGAPTHGLPVLARSCCSEHTVPWPAAGPAWTFLWVSGEMAGVKHNSSLSLPRDFLKQTTTTCQTHAGCARVAENSHLSSRSSRLFPDPRTINEPRKAGRLNGKTTSAGPCSEFGVGRHGPPAPGRREGPRAEQVCRGGRGVPARAELWPVAWSRGRRAGLGLRLSLRGCPVSTASDGGSG